MRCIKRTQWMDVNKILTYIIRSRLSMHNVFNSNHLCILHQSRSELNITNALIAMVSNKQHAHFEEVEPRPQYNHFHFIVWLTTPIIITVYWSQLGIQMRMIQLRTRRGYKIWSRKMQSWLVPWKLWWGNSHHYVTRQISKLWP